MTQTIRVSAGWNILSLPVIPADNLKTSIFPSAISDAMIFQEGYRTVDTLHIGQGFWIKFDASTAIDVPGETVSNDTIDLNIGWNMIGALSSPIPVNTVETDPPDIIASKFYQYMPGVGLQPTDTLQPGLGYWVKVK